MTKSNYRHVSLLPIPSKIFERVLSTQLSEYFDKIFDDFLCAFRKGHGYQTTLLRLLEDWKYALDNNEYVAAILMDLSKDFYCLPHDILLCKLSSYGLTKNATKLMESYLSDRKQQIKIGNVVSSWAEIKKGVPQGSTLGPLLFNVFINDNFFILSKTVIFITMQMTTRCHFIPLILMKLSKSYKRKVKCLLIGFVLTACRLIQTSFRPLVLEKEHMKDLQLSNLDPSKLHVIKKLNFWVLI